MSSLLQQNKTSLQEILNTVNTLSNSSTQLSPVISVNASGLITATAGAKSSTYQLAFQPAKTITPGTTSQVVVSSGYFTGGAITVKGDTNLTSGNIKSGISIFGINGTLDNTENSDIQAAIVTRTLSGSYTDTTLTTLGDYVFGCCSNLKTVDFPAVTQIGPRAFTMCAGLTTINFPKAELLGNSCFYRCEALTEVYFPQVTTVNTAAFRSCFSLMAASFPKATTIGSSAFGSCSSLTSVNFPKAITIGSSAFRQCYSLTTVSFPQATALYELAFYKCYNLQALYLLGSSMCALHNSDAFTSTPIGGYTASTGTYGNIYVPTSLVASYQAATNWTYFSSRIVAYEPIITFTIDGTEYQAEEGMTWAEWVDSDYNTIGGYLDGAEVWLPNDLWLDPKRNDIPCRASDTIVGGGQYTSYFEDVFE